MEKALWKVLAEVERGPNNRMKTWRAPAASLCRPTSSLEAGPPVICRYPRAGVFPPPGRLPKMAATLIAQSKHVLQSLDRGVLKRPPNTQQQGPPKHCKRALTTDRRCTFLWPVEKPVHSVAIFLITCRAESRVPGYRSDLHSPG